MAGRKIKIDNVEEGYEYTIDIPLDDEEPKEFKTGFKSALSELVSLGMDTLYTCRGYFALLLLVSAIIGTFSFYINNNVYNPKFRNFSDDNLFSGNSLVVSDEEVEQIVSAFEEELNVVIDDEFVDEYCVLNAIKENSNLSDEEKQFFYKYIDMIKDNPYLDKEKAYRSLLNVDVSYRKRPLTYDTSIEGVYIHDYESVGIFVEDEDKRVLGHEGIHTIFSTNEITENLPIYFYEGMTELLNNEYLTDNPFVELTNYPFEITAVKMLCELTSSDTVLKAFSLGDMSFIEDEIVELIGDRDKVVQALDMLEYAVLRYRDELGDADKTITDNNEVINGFIPIFRECIEAKYGSDSIDRLSYYYNEVLFLDIFDENAMDSYCDDLEHFGVDHKAYFSSNLKQQNNVENLDNTESITNIEPESSETVPVFQKTR